MIGCILTGHGSFAPGLAGALEMIAGPQEEFKVVPFLEEEGLDTFKDKMTAAINELKKNQKDLILFCDLLGGTPFNVAMTASQELEDVEVIAGTNLPLLIECAGMRFGDATLAEMVDHIIEVGKVGVAHAKIDIQDNDTDVEEEGI